MVKRYSQAALLVIALLLLWIAALLPAPSKAHAADVVKRNGANGATHIDLPLIFDLSPGADLDKLEQHIANLEKVYQASEQALKLRAEYLAALKLVVQKAREIRAKGMDVGAMIAALGTPPPPAPLKLRIVRATYGDLHFKGGGSLCQGDCGSRTETHLLQFARSPIEQDPATAQDVAILGNREVQPTPVSMTPGLIERGHRSRAEPIDRSRHVTLSSCGPNTGPNKMLGLWRTGKNDRELCMPRTVYN